MTRQQKVDTLFIAAETAYGFRASRAADIFAGLDAYLTGEEAKQREAMARAYLAVQEARDIVHFESSSRGQTTNVGAIAPLSLAMGFLLEDAALGARWVAPLSAPFNSSHCSPTNKRRARRARRLNL